MAKNKNNSTIKNKIIATTLAASVFVGGLAVGIHEILFNHNNENQEEPQSSINDLSTINESDSIKFLQEIKLNIEENNLQDLQNIVKKLELIGMSDSEEIKQMHQDSVLKLINKLMDNTLDVDYLFINMKAKINNNLINGVYENAYNFSDNERLYSQTNSSGKISHVSKTSINEYKGLYLKNGEYIEPTAVYFPPDIKLKDDIKREYIYAISKAEDLKDINISLKDGKMRIVYKYENAAIGKEEPIVFEGEQEILLDGDKFSTFYYKTGDCVFEEISQQKFEDFELMIEDFIINNTQLSLKL